MSTTTAAMDLPESEVKVRIARCPQCNNPVLVCVEHTMDKSIKKELAGLVSDGCDVSTVSLFKYRELIPFDFCQMNCDRSESSKKAKQ